MGEYVTLINPGTTPGGPPNGIVIFLDDPFPRRGFFNERLDVDSNRLRKFKMDNPDGPAPYTATWVPPGQFVEPDTMVTEGEPGPPGSIGPQGIPGPAGAQGEPGPALDHQGEWDSGTTYAVLDVVTYEGGSYVSKTALNSGNLPTQPASPNWSLLAEKGDVGDIGPIGPPGTFTPRGAWSSSVSYSIADLVTHGGANYASNTNGNVNHTPPNDTYWTEVYGGGGSGGGVLPGELFFEDNFELDTIADGTWTSVLGGWTVDTATGFLKPTSMGIENMIVLNKAVPDNFIAEWRGRVSAGPGSGQTTSMGFIWRYFDNNNYFLNQWDNNSSGGGLDGVIALYRKTSGSYFAFQTGPNVQWPTIGNEAVARLQIIGNNIAHSAVWNNGNPGGDWSGHTQYNAMYTGSSQHDALRLVDTGFGGGRIGLRGVPVTGQDMRVTSFKLWAV